MNVINLRQSPDSCNSYFLTNDGANGILIDCGDGNLARTCKVLGYNVQAVLLTHGHFDHVSGCAEFAKSGVPVYCGEGEKELIFCEKYLKICPFVRVEPFEVERTLKDGEILSLAGLEIKVIATPGHSAGSVSYLIENCLFSGDTLFAGGFGRYDFYGGDFATLIKSIKKLFSLEEDYAVYSGHGGATTLYSERENNPIRSYIC